MKKYQNTGGRNIAFIVDGKPYDFQNGQPALAPDNLVDEVKKDVSSLKEIDKKKKGK